MLWTEPFADGQAGYDSDRERFLSDTKFGGKAFSKIQRFVVVREQTGCCQCIPLVTYGGAGATKRGVNPNDYAAVYPEVVGGRQQLRPGEKMTKKPFPIKVENPNESIDPMSRLNFSRVYTVQHNLKVLKVGRIPDKYHTLLKQYYFESIVGLASDYEHITRTSTPEGPAAHRYEGTSTTYAPRGQIEQNPNPGYSTMPYRTQHAHSAPSYNSNPSAETYQAYDMYESHPTTVDYNYTTPVQPEFSPMEPSTYHNSNYAPAGSYQPESHYTVPYQSTYDQPTTSEAQPTKDRNDDRHRRRSDRDRHRR